MSRYRENPEALVDLVQADQVHRDLYIDPDVFAFEVEHLFPKQWIYVGHASQIQNPGDYYAADILGWPLVMVRQTDSSIRVLLNRCAHKGARIVAQGQGNTGRFFRCPYHAWAYRTDGSLASVPMKEDYEGTRLGECPAGKGLGVLTNVESYHGFVFIRMSADGLGFHEYFGDALATFDNLADRSPEGELVIAGGCLRNIIRCNWKIYLENIFDPVHTISTHESAATAAAAVKTLFGDNLNPVAMEQLLPFGNGYDFFTKSGARVFAHGHSILGTNASLHSGYARLADYEAALRKAHGSERAAEVLSFSPQNTVFYPSMAIKTAPQTMRIIRPLTVDSTLVETWALLPKGASPELLRRTLTYNRLVFSPMSAVAHDDIHVFEGIQKTLHAPGNEWISLHRGFQPGELDGTTQDIDDGNSELLMRNSHRAWVQAAGAAVADPAG